MYFQTKLGGGSFLHSIGTGGLLAIDSKIITRAEPKHNTKKQYVTVEF